jgi:hypothetical protein
MKIDVKNDQKSGGYKLLTGQFIKSYLNLLSPI